jgi:hypothetical protein
VTPSWTDVAGTSSTANLNKEGVDLGVWESGKAITSTANGDGQYTLTVTTVKTSNNLTAPTVMDFYLDSQKPASPTVTGVEAGKVYTASVTPVWADVTGTTSTATLAKGTANTIAYSSGSAISQNGSYKLEITTTKQANTLSTTTTIQFDIDSVKPAAPVVTGVSEGQTYETTAKPVVATWTEVQGVSYKATLQNGTGTADSYAKGAPITADGNYTLVVTAHKDFNGLEATTTIHFVIDSQPPAKANIVAVKDGTTPINNADLFKEVSPWWPDAAGTISVATLAKDGGQPVTFSKGNTITASGEYVLSVTVTKTANKLTTSKTVSFIVAHEGLAVTTLALANAHQGEDYSATLAATGGYAPNGYLWSVKEGTSLPQELTLSPEEVLSGKATAAGKFDIQLTVKDGWAQTPNSQDVTLSLIVLPPALNVTVPTVTELMQEKALPSVTLAATGGYGAYHWSATGLPLGVTIDAASGDLRGTPSKAGQYVATVTVADSWTWNTANTKTTTLTFNVLPKLKITSKALLPAGVTGQAYSQNLDALVAANGGKPDYTWNVKNLPSGLSFEPATGADSQVKIGQIIGTPSVAGVFSVEVSVTDSYSPASTLSLTFKLSISQAPPEITTVTDAMTTAFVGAEKWNAQQGWPKVELNVYPGDNLTLAGIFPQTAKIKGVLLTADKKAILLEPMTGASGTSFGVNLPQDLAKGRYVLTTMIKDGPFAVQAIILNVVSESWYATKMLNPLGQQAATSVTGNLTLPTTFTGYDGLSIAWTSSDAAVVGSDGTVQQPAYKDGDKIVTLAATLSWNGAKQERGFTFKVKALEKSDQDIVDTISDNLKWKVSQDDLNVIVDGSLKLPQSVDVGQDTAGITWTVSGDGAPYVTVDDQKAVSFSSEGKVLLSGRPAPGSPDAAITFSAVVKKGQASSKAIVFTGKILAQTKTFTELDASLGDLSKVDLQDATTLHKVISDTVDTFSALMNTTLDSSNKATSEQITNLFTSFNSFLKNLLGVLTSGQGTKVAKILNADNGTESDLAKVIDNAVTSGTAFVFRPDFGPDNLGQGIAIVKSLVGTVKETLTTLNGSGASEADKAVYTKSIETLKQAFAKIDHVAQKKYGVSGTLNAAYTGYLADTGVLRTALAGLVEMSVNLRVDASVDLGSADLASMASNGMELSVNDAATNTQVTLPQAILASIAGQAGTGSVAIKAEPLSGTSLGAALESLVGMQIVGAPYSVKVESGGKEVPVNGFTSDPAEVSLPIQEPMTVAKAKDLLASGQLSVRYFDTVHNTWINVEQQSISIDEANMRIVFKTPHFTDFVVTTLNSDAGLKELQYQVGVQTAVSLPVPFALTQPDSVTSMTLRITPNDPLVKSVKVNGTSFTATNGVYSGMVDLTHGTVGVTAISIAILAEDGTTSQTYSGTVSVVKALTLNSSGVPNTATAGSIYSGNLTATDGTTSYAWTAVGLPVELQLTPSTDTTSATLTGTLSQVGSVTFTLIVTDSSIPKQNTSQVITIVVSAPGAPSVTANDTDNTIVGITNQMEYKIDSVAYVLYDGNNPPDLSGAHTVLVRLAANPNTGAPAGADKTLVFNANSSAGNGSGGGTPTGGGGGAPAGGTTTPPATGSWKIEPTTQQLAQATTTQTVKQDQDNKVTAQDGTALFIPQRALGTAANSNVSVGVTIGKIGTAPQDTAVKMFDPVLTEREFTASVSTFTAPVTITIPYKGIDLTGIKASQLALYWWNPTTQKWVKVGGVVDLVTQTVSAPVYHFSAKTNSPLLFVDAGIPGTTSDYVSANKLQIGGLTMIGGTGVVSSNQESSLRDLLK